MGANNSQSDQEDDISDEEEGHCSQRVIEITTMPPILQLARDESNKQPLAVLDPRAIKFIPQAPRILPEEVQSELAVNVPAIEAEDTTENHSGTPLDHVIIDISEPNVQNSLPQSEMQTSGSTEQAQDTNISLESGQSPGKKKKTSTTQIYL